MRTLRLQLLVSHLLLVLIMGLVMSVATTSFFRLGRSVDTVAGSFGGILAAQNMRDALGRQQSSLSFVLAGQYADARREFEESWPRFRNALRASAMDAEGPLRPAFQEMLEISEDYESSMRNLLKGAEAGDISTPRFRETVLLLTGLQSRTYRMFSLHQDAIVEANNRVKDDIHVAARNSLAVTAIALIVAILLALRMIRVALKPLEDLAQEAEIIGAGDFSRRIRWTRRDELGALAASFNRMAEKLQAFRQQEVRALQRAEQMSDAALEFLYDPVVVTDAKGNIVRLNRAAEGLFGPTPATPRKPKIEQMGDRRIVRAIQNAIREDRVSASEDETALVPLKVGGAERTYRLRASPMKGDDGTTLGCVAVLEDITHLRELDRLKNEFIGVASHELRTPVTSLLLSVQLLQEGVVGSLTDAQREIVEVQRQELERLDRLMHELLDITRLEAGTSPPRMELVSALDLARSAVEAIRAKAEKKGVRLAADLQDGLPVLRADSSQITRVLVNLIDNAVRHTPTGGSVLVQASASNNHVTFRVEDTGEGIPPEYLGSIFDRFVQVPGATQGGAGLGLSIANTIIKAHGGQMRVESELHKGSVFSFDLPLDPPVAGEDFN